MNKLVLIVLGSVMVSGCTLVNDVINRSFYSNIKTQVGGIVSPSGPITHSVYTSLNVNAYSDANFHFVKWIVSSKDQGADLSDLFIQDRTSNSTTITCHHSNTSSQINPFEITAEFARNNYTLSTEINGPGTINYLGSFSTLDWYINTIIATPTLGNHFVNWTVSGGITINSTINPSIVVVVNSNGVLIANFAVGP